MATKKSTATKKAAKKSTTEKKPKASLGAKKTVATKTATGKAKKVKLTPEELFVKTQELAYLLAEKDGFSRNPTHYWLDAETAVAQEL
jgi:hypothetical protein